VSDEPHERTGDHHGGENFSPLHGHDANYDFAMTRYYELKLFCSSERGHCGPKCFVSSRMLYRKKQSKGG
jgi:hypothetical protein